MRVTVCVNMCGVCVRQKRRGGGGNYNPKKDKQRAGKKKTSLNTRFAALYFEGALSPVCPRTHTLVWEEAHFVKGY